MINERLKLALAWCKKHNIESSRLKKFNRESKDKPRTPRKTKNPYLKSDGGIDLIDKDPSYKRKRPKITYKHKGF